MKKKTLIIDENKKKSNVPVKLIVTIALIILCIVMIVYTVKIYVVNEKFADSVSEIARLNSKTVFSIDRIYLYSSADANSNETNKPVWDLDIFQFTDIAIYINNRDESGVTYENTIKTLTIDNVKFNGLETGNPKLYYKNVNDFAKLEINEANEIKDSIEFNIVNTGDADYTKPVIYSNCQNPVTLEYVNSEMKENTTISDISQPLTYDGSLLQKSGISLNSIKCNLSFRVTIVNNYNQKFVATVYIDIPLEDSFTNESIYNGSIVKNMENSNIVKFIRVE